MTDYTAIDPAALAELEQARRRKALAEQLSQRPAFDPARAAPGGMVIPYTAAETARDLLGPLLGGIAERKAATAEQAALAKVLKGQQDAKEADAERLLKIGRAHV